MKVGIVCPYDLEAPGGVQQLTRELTEELRRTGDEVVLIGAGKTLRTPEEARVGWSIKIRANESVVPLTLSPLSWWRVRKLLKGVEVVNVHEPFIPLVGWAALSGKKPTVATFHADPPGRVVRFYRRTRLKRRQLRKAVLTAASPFAARAIPDEWGPVEVVPNAINVASYDLPVERIDRQVCFLGRDDPRKGLDLLLEAWPMIRESVPDAELKVMGAKRVERIDGVEFLGRVSDSDKRHVLTSSLVYVAPNTGGESFGIVVAEAMAAGCAVVCSDLDAFKEVIGEAGRLTPMGDTTAIADAVIDLLSDPDAARQLGGRARSEVARFDWGVIATRYQLMYRRAISG